MVCFNVSDFPHTADDQINDLHRETDKISQVTSEWPSLLSWLSPSLRPLLAIIIHLCLFILIRLAIKAIDSIVTSIIVTSFSSKN